MFIGITAFSISRDFVVLTPLEAPDSTFFHHRLVTQEIKPNDIVLKRKLKSYDINVLNLFCFKKPFRMQVKCLINRFLCMH